MRARQPEILNGHNFESFCPKTCFQILLKPYPSRLVHVCVFNFDKQKLKKYSHSCSHSFSVGRTRYSLSSYLVSKKLAKTDKSSLRCGHLNVSSNRFNFARISQNCRKIWKRAEPRGPKNCFNKVYQVDISQNEKIETNTIRLFSDQLDSSERSYAEFAQKYTLFLKVFGWDFPTRFYFLYCARGSFHCSNESFCQLG